MTGRLSRPPAPKPSEDERAAKIIRDVVAEGTWASLLPLPIDGLVLAESRSVEYASHEVRVRGRVAVSCSGPCGMHPICWHRVQVALACWQAEHKGWDIEAVKNDRGEPQASLIHRLIDAYLTKPKRPHTKWWLGDPGTNEVRYAGPEPSAASVL